GLLLEIDALAVTGRTRTPVSPANGAGWAGSATGYPAAWLAGDELFIGGQLAPDAGSLQAQTEATLMQITGLLEQSGGRLGDLVKLNVYYHDPAVDATASFKLITDALQKALEPGRTVVSIVEVPGLM